MNKDWVLTQESFDELLAWLDPDREEAGQKYEDIRHRLIKIFTCRGCNEPEDLTDETINRVIKRLKEIQKSYDGDPVRYFFGVANKVHMEYLRRRQAPTPLPPDPDSTQVEHEFQCLEKCMKHLTPRNRTLVLEYYREDKRAKIDHRKQLAAQFGIAINALRIRAHRIRAALEECVEECVRGLIA